MSPIQDSLLQCDCTPHQKPQTLRTGKFSTVGLPYILELVILQVQVLLQLEQIHISHITTPTSSTNVVSGGSPEPILQSIILLQC